MSTPAPILFEAKFVSGVMQLTHTKENGDEVTVTLNPAKIAGSLCYYRESDGRHPVFTSKFDAKDIENLLVGAVSEDE